MSRETVNNPFSDSHLYIPGEELVYKVVESDFVFNGSRKPEEGPEYHMFGQGTYVFFGLDGALDYHYIITNGTKQIARFRINPSAIIFDYTGKKVIEDASFELDEDLLRLYMESVNIWANVCPYADKASLIEDVKKLSKRLGRTVDYNDLINYRNRQLDRDSRAVFSVFLRRLGFSGIAFWYESDAGNIWDMSCLEFNGFLDEEDEL